MRYAAFSKKLREGVDEEDVLTLREGDVISVLCIFKKWERPENQSTGARLITVDTCAMEVTNSHGIQPRDLDMMTFAGNIQKLVSLPLVIGDAVTLKHDGVSIAERMVGVVRSLHDKAVFVYLARATLKQAPHIIDSHMGFHVHDLKRIIVDKDYNLSDKQMTTLRDMQRDT